MLKKIEPAIIYMFLASLSFAIMGACAKIVSSNLPSLEITFFRNIFGVAIISFALFKAPPKNRGGKFLLLVFRGTIGFIALLLYFYNMANIPLGVAITYNKTSPIFVAFFAWLFLNEKLPKNAIYALFVGFIGILLIAKPIGVGFSKYDILGIFSGIGAALAYTSIRELRRYYDIRTIALSFMLVGTIGPIILFIISNYIPYSSNLDFIFAKFVMPSIKEWYLIIIIGLSATIAQLLMTKAYSLSKAGIVGTITYTQIIFGTIAGVILGDNIPDIYTLLGMTLVIIAGILVIYQK